MPALDLVILSRWTRASANVDNAFLPAHTMEGRDRLGLLLVDASGYLVAVAD